MSPLPEKILLATDGSVDARLAARAAADLSDKTGAELHIIHAWQYAPNPVLDPEHYQEEAKRLLKEQTELVTSAGATVTETYLTMAPPVDAILDLSEEIRADLIVVGSRGLGPFRRALMSSVSESVIHHAHASVLVVRREPISFPTKVPVATDGSDEAALAARTAADLAARTGSELQVGHVGEIGPVYHPERHGYLAQYDRLQEEARRLLDEQVEEMRAAGGTVAQTHLRMGIPDKEIVGVGEEIGAGLIVEGSRGIDALRRALMGSVSHSVVRHAHCPVLVVRQEKQEEAGLKT